MTKQADYGIVLMSHLAGRPGRRFTAPELAVASKLPAPTVSKILKLLGRAALLDSHRGAKGGYSLAREPRRISVAEMIAALDGPIAFTECIEDTPGECSQEAVCCVRGSWQRINLALRQTLESISLADLMASLSGPPQAGPRQAGPSQGTLVQLGSGDADAVPAWSG